MFPISLILSLSFDALSMTQLKLTKGIAKGFGYSDPQIRLLLKEFGHLSMGLYLMCLPFFIVGLGRHIRV